MNAPADPHAITSLPQLEALFGAIAAPSFQKEVNYLHPAYQALIRVYRPSRHLLRMVQRASNHLPFQGTRMVKAGKAAPVLPGKFRLK